MPIHQALKVSRPRLADLELHPDNPHQGDIGVIAESLEALGQYRAIVVQKSRMRVCAGNHTVQAARLLGWERIDAHVVDVTDEEATRILVVDNRSAQLGWDDPEGLTRLLESLAETDAGLLATGYDGDDLDDLLMRSGQGPEPEDPELHLPPVPAKAVTKPGDVWILGRHRLICGDALSRDTYTALLAGELADACFTDPPYNVAYEGGTEDRLSMENDDMSDDDFLAFLRSAFRATSSSMVEGGPIYVCHADSKGELFRRAFVDAGFLLKQVLVWVKQRFVLGRQDYNWQHEPILYGWKEGAAHPWYGSFSNGTVLDDDSDPSELSKAELVELLEAIRAASTVVREDRPDRNAEHPTMKPVPLCARLIENSTKAGQLVLDPFAGSGSTLIACEQLLRRAAVIELDPRYCDVIATRYQRYTGTTPVLERTGKARSFT